MPAQVHFLKKESPLASQVAEFMLAGLSGHPLDLRGTEVWVPTAGAGRKIRYEVARQAGADRLGVLPPQFLQPMQALLPRSSSEPAATRAEREGAWAQVLESAARERLDALFPHEESLQGERALLAAGGMLCELGDLLAEGGHEPGSPEVLRACSQDAGRWEQIRWLYSKYLSRLSRDGLSDPNALRVREIASPRAGGLQHLVIAGIPDLPGAAAKYASALASAGVDVDVLVWAPGEMGGGFDAWGRPLTGEWEACRIPLGADQIRIAKDPADEADRALRFCSLASSPGDYAVVLADPDLAPAFCSEILRHAVRPFLPDGDPLSRSEPAAVALGWLEWCAGGDLRGLRRLLECPAFAGWLGGRCRLAPARLLAACDFLQADVLAADREGAKGFLNAVLDETNRPADFAPTGQEHFLPGTQGGAGACPGLMDSAPSGLQADSSEGEATSSGLQAPAPAPRSRPQAAWAAALLAQLDLVDRLSPAEMVREVWRESGGEAARQVLASWDELSASRIFRSWPEGRGPAFLRSLQAAATFEASQAGDIELSGWLEAPWVDASRLALCGCVEGRLPASISEHAFLPDSIRRQLGLLDNASRRARDAFLLTSLLASRPPGNFCCSFSKSGADGGPSLPSGLLLRCADDELAPRILTTFRKVESRSARPRRANGWRWQLTEAERIREIRKISPTDFKEYLACPFRYYLKRVLHLEAFDPRAREMDALQFGTLVHKALEDFALESPDACEEEAIARAVLRHLDRQAARQFGPSPAPAVRVQLAAARVRLRAFARLQAVEFAAGWRIVAVEKKLSADDVDPLRVGPLALSAKIDRIEEHPQLGLRIVDYKTYGTTKPPAATHFGPASANSFLDAAQTTVAGKPRCWIDLQLPLYRLIAEHLYPGRPVQTAYFILPADPSQSAIEALDLTGELYESALACASEVAGRVSQRRFWPPQSAAGPWEDPFAPLFLNGRAEDCFDAGTISFLKGDA